MSGWAYFNPLRTLYPSDDEDWYKFHVDDTAGCIGTPAIRVSLENLPADLDLDVFFVCDSSDESADISCDEGSDISRSGLQGCRSDNWGTSNDYVEFTPDCPWTFNESGVAYIRVYSVFDVVTCDGYELWWQAD